MVIAPTGRTLRATAIGVAAQLTAMVPVTRATSWYTRWGDWVGRLVVITVLTLTGITWWKPNRKLG